MKKEKSGLFEAKMFSLYGRGRLKRDWRFQTTFLPRGNGNGTYNQIR